MDSEAIHLFGFTIWLSPLPPSVPNHPGTHLINHLWIKYITAKVHVLTEVLSTRPWALSAEAFRKEAAQKTSNIWPFLCLTTP